MSKRTRAAALGAAATALAAGLGAYPVFFRRWCLTWGARPDRKIRRTWSGQSFLGPQRAAMVAMSARIQPTRRPGLGPRASRDLGGLWSGRATSARCTRSWRGRKGSA